MNEKYIRKRPTKKLFTKLLLGCMCSFLPCVVGSDRKVDAQARQAWERLRQTDFATIANDLEFYAIKTDLQIMVVAPEADVPNSRIKPTVSLNKKPFYTAYGLLEILSSQKESEFNTLKAEGWQPDVFVTLDTTLSKYIMQYSFLSAAFGIKTEKSNMDSAHAVLSKILKGYVAVYDKEEEERKKKEHTKRGKKRNLFTLFKKSKGAPNEESEAQIEYELHQQDKHTRQRSKPNSIFSHATLLQSEKEPEKEIEVEPNIYHPVDVAMQPEILLVEEKEEKKSKAPLGIAFFSALGAGWILNRKKKPRVTIKKLTKSKPFTAKNLGTQKNKKKSPPLQISI